MDGKKTAILVCSCDKFSDLWQPYFESFHRYWADCPYPVYLLSNFKKTDFRGIRTITVGEDDSWSKNLIDALKQLEEYDYVFLMTEDGFLCSNVDTTAFLECIKLFRDADGKAMCMMAEQWPSSSLNSFFGEVVTSAPYRCNATFSIWKKRHLLALLVEDESAWQFELNGTDRTRHLTGFFNTKKNFFPHIHGVKKGKWIRSSLRELKALGFRIETQRPVISWYRDWAELVYFKLRLIAYWLLPGKIIKILQRWRWRQI